jgi:hypothetical protein
VTDVERALMSYDAPPPPPEMPPPPPPYGPPPSEPPAKRSTLAVVSLICGVVGMIATCFCGLGVAVGIAGIVTGFLARREIARSDGRVSGAGFALGGIIAGALSVLILLAALVLFATGAVDPAGAAPRAAEPSV